MPLFTPSIMDSIDRTEAFSKHRGKWIAFKSDRETVIGVGDSLKAAKAAAKNKGVLRPDCHAVAEGTT